MQGNITMFREDIGFGIIQGSNGQKFRFSRKDVSNPNAKLVGLEVDFLVESHKPRDIIVLHGSPWAVFGRAGAAVKRS
ncbi:MAG: hypothetical protein WC807_10370 [Hyphomicrobium sp.]